MQADVQTALVTRYCLHTEEWNRTGVTVTAIPPCPAAVCWEEKRCEVPKRVVLALVEEPFDFQTGFTELPMGLVEDLLSQSSKLAEHIRKQIQEMEQVKKEVREQLKREGVLRRDGDFGYYDVPTSCGVDGAYATERLLALDFGVAAAVAVEGIIPPSARSYWSDPQHKAHADAYAHSDDTPVILRALMMEFELELAEQAPHDVVFLDGSMATPIILMDQAINRLIEQTKQGTYHALAVKVLEGFPTYLRDYLSISSGKRSDKIWVASPKYSSNREFGKVLQWRIPLDDRAVFTYVLEAGEFAGPVQVQRPARMWHLTPPNENDEVAKQQIEKLINQLTSLQVIYYRPTAMVPAMRLEVPAPVATNDTRLAMLLQAVKHQCMTPGVMEPFPLYMADRMVKHIGAAMPALRQNATTALTEDGIVALDMDNVFFSLHGYRSESGGY